MSGLRVIGGKARGMKLRSVPGDTTRPVTDRVKVSLFNIIGADIEGATLLDLFAGTGSIGIEALSRGAAFVRFLDLNRRAVDTIQSNLTHTRLESGAEVLRGDAFAFLDRPADRVFDYIYIAPPQYKGLWKQALLEVDQRVDWLSEDTWVIVQIHPREYEQVQLSNLELFEERTYGSTLLVIYRRLERGLEI
ncbi:MAG: 16S rRNA (guanine(966)-N(2))-methyltransferase RsmD [Anaerolineales bacterium]